MNKRRNIPLGLNREGARELALLEQRGQREQNARRCFASARLTRGICFTETVRGTERVVYLPATHTHTRTRFGCHCKPGARTQATRRRGSRSVFAQGDPRSPSRLFQGAVQGRGGNKASFQGTSFRTNPAGSRHPPLPCKLGECH